MIKDNVINSCRIHKFGFLYIYHYSMFSIQSNIIFRKKCYYIGMNLEYTSNSSEQAKTISYERLPIAGIEIPVFDEGAGVLDVATQYGLFNYENIDSTQPLSGDFTLSFEEHNPEKIEFSGVESIEEVKAIISAAASTKFEEGSLTLKGISLEIDELGYRSI